MGMWDGMLTSRVKDRKMNEIFTFAAMIKVDSSKKSQYVKLIDALSDDIDACEALIASKGEARPAVGIIDQSEYISRLSPAEKADEDEFNSYKVVPAEIRESDDEIVDRIRELIVKAASGLSSDDSEIERLRAENSELNDRLESVSSVKDELRICRQRIEDLSKELDFAKCNVQTLEEENSELRSKADDSEEVSKLREENTDLRDRIEAMLAVKDELRICRQRIEDLSKELDDSRAKVQELEIERSKATEVPKVDLSWIDEKVTPLSEILDQVVDSSSESSEYYVEKLTAARDSIEQIIEDAKGQMDAAGLGDIVEPLRKLFSAQASFWISLNLLGVRSAPPSVEDSPVSEEVSEQKEQRPIYDVILSPDELQILSVVSVMKSAKIDFFVDMSMSGRFNEDACEDVIDFLKVDLQVIRHVLSMDYTSKESIEGNFKAILDLLNDSPAPKHQKMYINSLTMDEKVLEDSYNQIMAHVERVLNDRYSYVAE